jgi:hypothetical protein
LIFTVGACGIDEGDLAYGGELLEHGREGKIHPRLPYHLVGEGGKGEGEHAAKGVDPELLVGPVVGGLLGEKVGVLHALEGLLDAGEITVGGHHLAFGPVSPVCQKDFGVLNSSILP